MTGLFLIFGTGIIIGVASASLIFESKSKKEKGRFYKYGCVGGWTEGYIEGLQDHAELIKVLREVYEAAEYWSDYDVPVTLKDDIKSVVDKVAGKIREAQ